VHNDVNIFGESFIDNLIYQEMFYLSIEQFIYLLQVEMLIVGKIKESLFQKETLLHEPLVCLRNRQADPPRVNMAHPKD
jgi:hypothetical protein